jgi:DNA-3-methyladenine glycosylase II
LSKAGTKKAVTATDVRPQLDDEFQRRAIIELIDIEPRFSEVVQSHGSPPLWRREESFGSLIQIILEQQVSLASARAAFARLTEAVDELSPDSLLGLSDTQLRAAGFSRQKTSYARNLASALQSRSLDLVHLRSLSDDEVRSELTAIKGIGVWTANIYLLTAMRRPDVWPRGDIALAASYQQLKRLPKRPDSDQMARISQAWSPHRSVAARLLWHHYLSRSKNV